jgi:hypothetical protein
VRIGCGSQRAIAFAVKVLNALFAFALPAHALAQTSSAPAVLTNERVMQIVQSGFVPEAEVLRIIRSSPSVSFHFTPADTDVLQRAGVSVEAIKAMAARQYGGRSDASGVAPVAGPLPPVPVAPVSHPTPAPIVAVAPGVAVLATTVATDWTLHEGTPVRMRLMRTLSSAQAQEGANVDFETLDDIAVNGKVVIPRNSVAMATITSAEAKKHMGRSGKLSVNIDYVRLPTGEKLALRGIENPKVGGHVGAMTGAIVATSILFWPAAPFFLLMHGKDISIPEGHEVRVYTNSDYKVEALRF